MANEITIRLGVEIVKNGSRIAGVGDEKQDLPGNQMFADVQVIGFAAPEAVSLPADLIAAGVSLVWLKNLNATHFITITADGSDFHLDPGVAMLLRYPATPAADPTITAQSDTAACDLEVIAAGPKA